MIIKVIGAVFLSFPAMEGHFISPPLFEGKIVMKQLRMVLFSLMIVVLLAGVALAQEHLKLATTTSTENSGLLSALLPTFEAQNHCKVDVIAVGTGKAIKLGMAGDVDVILVHARAKEDAFVDGGYGVDRQDVMYNDFVVVGPTTDPAGIKGTSDVAAALAKIAHSKATFVSRGDESGTHFKELSLWKAADLKPAGDWYLEAGRGMGEVLTMADERQGYALTDRGTYIAYQDKISLKVVVEGDKRLFNPYGVIPVNPAKHPHVKFKLATAFANFLTGETGQHMIDAYRKNNQQLFFTYEK